LRRATRFVDSWQFAGFRFNQDQRLDWPRAHVGVVDGQHVLPGTVPQRVKEACIEAALRDAKGEDLLPDTQGGTVKSESKQVGNLRTNTEFATPRQQKPAFKAIDALLRPYALSGSSRRLSRAIA